MITFPRLGTAGRLGNQLFQIAGTYSIAQDYGEQVSFPPWDYQPYFNVPHEWFGGQPGRDAGEMLMLHDPRHRRFLQDIRIWHGYENHIYEMFQPSDTAMQYLYANYVPFFDHYKSGRGLISLHVRRGDNAARANPDLTYPLPTMDYYRRALAQLPIDDLIIVFSDEPEWCMNHLMDEIDRDMLFIQSQTRPETQPGKKNPLPPMDWTDMALMTMCSSHIIANSSYSWWGAWLAVQGNHVFYPSAWYGPLISEYADWRLIIPSWWTEVPV